MREHRCRTGTSRSAARSSICSQGPRCGLPDERHPADVVQALPPGRVLAVYFTVRGDDIDYEAAVGGAAVARAHMEAVKRRLKEEKNAKDEDVLVSLQLVNEMLSRGYAFLPIELGKSRGNKYIVEDGKVRLPFCALKGVGGTAAASLERATIDGQEYISVEELQQATGVTSAVLESLRTAGVLADLPESSQVSFF